MKGFYSYEKQQGALQGTHNDLAEDKITLSACISLLLCTMSR
jgi:hypothetical protein